MTSVAAPSDPLSACEEYYGLIAHPFSLTPDLRFVYPSHSHSHAFEQVTDALKRREGLIVITGEIGTGKTMLCRTLLETFEARTFLSVILDPSLGIDDLLQQVLTDFGLITVGGSGLRLVRHVDRHQLVSTLQRFLKSLIPVGAHAVIMIDEAQHLDPTVLEELRLLSNFETDEAKLLQIVLVGQPDLDEVLRRPDMQQLSQRIARRVELHPLSSGEVQDYIDRRLLVAGDAATHPSGNLSPEQVRFTPSAVGAVAAISRGIPRVINTVCDQALEIGFEQQKRAIDRAAVIAAARRLKVRVPPASRPVGAFLWAVAGLVLMLGAVGAWRWSTHLPRAAVPPTQATPAATQTPAPPLQGTGGPLAQPLPLAPPSDAAAAVPLAAAPETRAAGVQAGGYEIAVAAFRTAQRAEQVAEAIAQRGLPVSTRADPTGSWYRIVVGPFDSTGEAESAQVVLARQGFAGTKVSPSPSGGR